MNRYDIEQILKAYKESFFDELELNLEIMDTINSYIYEVLGNKEFDNLDLKTIEVYTYGEYCREFILNLKTHLYQEGYLNTDVIEFIHKMMANDKIEEIISNYNFKKSERKRRKLKTKA